MYTYASKYIHTRMYKHTFARHLTMFARTRITQQHKCTHTYICSASLLAPISRKLRPPADTHDPSVGVVYVCTYIHTYVHTYMQGLMTGVVVDSGDGVTHIIPVWEGFSIPHLTKRINLAGRNITDYLIKLLQHRGYSFNRSADFETVSSRTCMYVCARMCMHTYIHGCNKHGFFSPSLPGSMPTSSLCFCTCLCTWIHRHLHD